MFVSVARADTAPAEPAAWSVNEAIGPAAVSTLAGNSTIASVDGTGASASFYDPIGFSVAGGVAWTIDANHLRSIDLATGQVTTGPGGGSNGYECIDSGPSTQPNVGYGWDHSLVNDGQYLYWADSLCGLGSGRGVLREASLATGAVSTLPGPINASDVTVGPGGALYASDGSYLYRVDPATGSKSTVVDLLSDPSNPSSEGMYITGLTADGTTVWASVRWAENIFNGTQNEAIVRINPSSGAATVIYSHNDQGAASFAVPLVSAGNYLYVAASTGVFRFAKSSGTYVEIAGAGSGYADGVGGAALFGDLSGIDTDGTSLYVADADNRRIRKLGPTPPAAATSAYPPTGLGPTELAGGSNPSEGCNCGHNKATLYPVDTATGAFWHNFTDLSTSGRGPTLQLTRSYSSVNAALDGSFGYGWSSNYSAHLTVDPVSSDITVHQEDGSTVAFVPASGGTYTPIQPRELASLVENADKSFTFVRRDRMSYNFSNSGQLTSITDLDGYTTTLTYNDAGNLATVTNPAGRSYTFASSGGHVTSVTDSANHTVSYGYSASGDLASVTDPAGAVWTFTYDGSHRLLSMLDPNQQSQSSQAPLTNVYDTAGRVTSQTDFAGRTTTFDYTSIANATKVTDPAGRVTVDYYSTGLRTQSVTGYGTSSAAATSFTYDPVTEQLASITDPDNHTASYQHDARGNLTKVTDPMGRVTTRTYDAVDDELTTTDPAGVTTTNTYTAQGHLRSTSTPLLAADGHTVTATRTTTVTYDDPAHPGDATAVTDADGNTTHLSYDSDGHLLSITAPSTPENPAGNKTTYTYDATTGWLASTTAPKGNLAGAAAGSYTTTYFHDADGRILQIKDPSWSSANPSLHQTSRSYDLEGNVTTATDADGHPTSYGYDADNELVSTTRPDNTVIRQSWNADGQLATRTDAAGHVTTYIYTPRGQLASSENALSKTTSYSYDLVGNAVLIAEPDVNCAATPAPAGCIRLAYDADNELTSRSYLDGVTHAVGWSYDADGRRTQMTDGTGTSSYSYDSLGRLTSTTDGAGKTTGYSYDLAGNQTSIVYPGNHTVTRTYDAANRLASTTDWLGNTTTYSYDADSNPTTQKLPAATGETDTTAYDQLDQISSITDSKGSATLANFAYTYDPAGQIASDTTTGSGMTAPIQNYSYNTLNQLTASGQTSTPTSYAYDPADNLTNRATTGAAANTQAFDAGNQLCWTSPSAVASPACASAPTGATKFGYDPSGNRTSTTSSTGVHTTYGYDEADHLTSSTTSAVGAVDNFVPVTPARALDTRTGAGGVPVARLAPNHGLTYQATGVNGVPAAGGVSAVVFNLTAVNPSGTGIVRVAPGGTSNVITPLAYYDGQGISSSVIAQTNAQGQVSILNYGGTIDVAIDVVGYYTTTSGASAGGAFVPITAVRALDTRTGAGGVPVAQVIDSHTLTLQVTGVNGVPASNVTSAVFAVTAINPTATGIVRVAPAGTSQVITPLAYYAGQSITELVVGKLSTSGAITFYNYGGTIDLAVDLIGYYTSPSTATTGAGFAQVTPTRALDTRSGAGSVPVALVPANQSVTLQVTGVNGVPVIGPSAVVFDLTAVNPVGDGVVQVAPGSSTNFTTAVTYHDGQGITDAVIEKLGTNGTITILNTGGTTDLAVDLVGYDLPVNTATSSTYNGDGLRTSHTSGSTLSRFTWDISAGLPLLESDSTNIYVYGLGDRPLEQINTAAGAVTWLHGDRLGSTRLLTDNTGTVVGTMNYDPYGTATSTTGTAATPFRYAGEYTDDDTGFVYLRARYYDPAAGQFLGIDPLLAITGSAYGYTSGDPVNGTDPTGMAEDVEQFFDGGDGGPLEFDDANPSPDTPQSDTDTNSDSSTSAPTPAPDPAEMGTQADTPPCANAEASAASPESILKPGGESIGRSGTDESIRELDGDLSDAETIFRELAKDGKIVASNDKFTRAQLPDGGYVQLRTVMSNSPNTAATIDINIQGIDITKLKFNP